MVMTFVSKPASVRAADAAAIGFAIERQFDFRSQEYQSLQQRSCTTAFQDPGWLDALHRQVAPAVAAEPVTVTARERPGGRLLLVLPLARCRRKGVTFIEFADFGLCDYLRPVYDPADAPILLGDATLPKRVGALLPRYDVVALTKMADHSPILEHLFPNALRARMRVSAYPLNVGAVWTHWRAATLDPSFRRDLDIKRRRLSRRGTSVFMLVEQASEIARAFDALRTFRADRFDERGAHDVIDNDAVFSFYRQIAVDGARSGTARTYCLYHSGEPVAIMFGLVHARTFSLLLVGFDVIRFRRLSVGLLAIEDTIRASIEAGDTIYDFTIGDYRYKEQFGAQSVPLYEWHVARTVRGHLALLAIGIVREAKRVLKPMIRGG
jgi:CelD/BcsL family acetyltransferase involved in cellulose biosynthesis